MSDFVVESNRGGYSWSSEVYSPPWVNGFDVSFSTESKVPTWDPMWKPGSQEAGAGTESKEITSYGTYYWTGKGTIATENLQGDDSRVIMDRAIPFIEESANNARPFLAVIWFHTPHSPVVAGPKYKAMYARYDENKQHYYGAVTAMDEQVGRLREKLRELKIAENTLLFFTSDNGPAGGTSQVKGRRQQGLSGPYRGRKGSLYEGGIRVPGLLEWPAEITEHRETDVPAVTSDYYPTIIDLLDLEVNDQPRPLDGVSLLSLIEGTMQKRNEPIGFTLRDQQAWMDDRYKIYSSNGGESFELYDLVKDLAEQQDLSQEMPEKADAMNGELEAWLQSLQRSDQGADYAR